VRELNQGHVTELFLSVVCYSNGSDTALDDDVVCVILAVSNMHDGVLCGQRAAADPEWSTQVSQVWLWNEYPNRWGRDCGIDLVFRHKKGQLSKPSAIRPLGA
jgi:hypothetical protein